MADEKDDIPEGFMRADDGKLYPARIAQAYLCASSVDDPSLAEKCEEAMRLAVLKALDDGVSIEDGEEIGRRTRAAHDKVIAEHGG